MSTTLKSITRLLLAAIAAIAAGCSGADDNEELLAKLDQAISNRGIYRQLKDEQLSRLRGEIETAQTDEQKFHAMGHLLDEYMSYNTDSALAIARRRIAFAEKSGNSELKTHAALSLANVQSLMGMYKEAIDLLNSVNRPNLPEYLRPYYYHINRTVYGFMADFAGDPDEKVKYANLVNLYRDSLMRMNEPGSFYYLLGEADGMNANGNAKEGAETLERYLTDNQLSEHEKAIAAYTLSESYRILGDHKNEKKQLTISAINDMRSGVNEYVSLRKLALLLYGEGDVKHAYDYLNICLNDAKECNARLRILEINDIFPIVNQVYLDTIGQQQTRLKRILLLVCVMSVVLLMTLYWIYREKKKVEDARQSVSDINTKLANLNADLQTANERLLAANNSIKENSYLKEEYIAQYMNQCALYIDKIDRYQKTISRAMATKQLDEMKKIARTLPSSDEEAKAFYDNFDDSFLKLFPSFIKDFNALLLPEEAIIPKTQGKLNTELRIFALIRLGITDSAMIARFLRYSVTTIYNYRTRVRNKARGNRDQLEKNLMKIGDFS